MDCTVEIANSGYTHNIRIPLGLDNNFAATNWIRVKCNRINSSVTAGLCNFNLSAILAEFLLE